MYIVMLMTMTCIKGVVKNCYHIAIFFRHSCCLMTIDMKANSVQTCPVCYVCTFYSTFKAFATTYNTYQFGKCDAGLVIYIPHKHRSISQDWNKLTKFSKITNSPVLNALWNGNSCKFSCHKQLKYSSYFFSSLKSDWRA